MLHQKITDDPDLAQAIEDLRPVFAELRQAKREMRKAKDKISSNAYQSLAAHAADQRSIIATRARKLAIEPEALSVILSTEAQIRMRVRRAPSRRQMEKELRAERGYAASRLSGARADMERLQAELASAERHSAAADAAVLLYTGFPN